MWVFILSILQAKETGAAGYEARLTLQKHRLIQPTCNFNVVISYEHVMHLYAAELYIACMPLQK